MGKMKTRKGVAKRFKITKTGKVLHGSQNRSHLRSQKSKSNRRRLKEPGHVAPQFAKKVKQMVGEA